jgi:hypothetical protein
MYDLTNQGGSPACAGRDNHSMPEHWLTEAEISRFTNYPAEISEVDLIPFFTLTDDDLKLIGRLHHNPKRLLGFHKTSAAEKKQIERWLLERALEHDRPLFLLQLLCAMRDDVDALARDLQRSKTTKDERVTADTVMRIAAQLLIDYFQFKRGNVANSEEYLYTLATQKLKLK